jgi:hypothetical protein
MKTRSALLFIPLLASCAMIGTGTIQGVLNRVVGYDVKIERLSNSQSLPSILPKDASAYIEYGADSCLVATFTGQGSAFHVQIIDFLTPKGAMASYVYGADRNAKPEEIGFTGSRTSDAIRFVKGVYVVTVSTGAGADMEGAVKLARALAKNTPVTGLSPELYLPLPKDGLEKGSELYFEGPVVFSQRFSSGMAEALDIPSSIEGVAGIYTLSGGGKINFVKVRFTGRKQTLSAVDDYIRTREGRSMIRPTDVRQYYTVFNPDGTEVYIAEYAEWLLFIPDGPKGGGAQQFFETVFRSM